MSKFKVEISCDNAAFGEDQDCASAEVVAILKRLIEKLETGSIYSVLRDSNGNKVGEASF